MNDPLKIIAIQKWLSVGSINIFGKPFAGKDYQAIKLIELLGGKLIGGGDILRGVEMPEHIKTYMKTGKLIPSGDYEKIVLPYLNQERFNNQPLFLSSVGRWHGEETGVINSLTSSNHNLKTVIYLNISDVDSFNRWQNRKNNIDRPERPDDTEKVLEIRLREFREKTIPVIEYYKNRNMLIEVDGTKTRDEVTLDIIEKLYELSTK